MRCKSQTCLFGGRCLDRAAGAAVSELQLRCVVDVFLLEETQWLDPLYNCAQTLIALQPAEQMRNRSADMRQEPDVSF